MVNASCSPSVVTLPFHAEHAAVNPVRNSKTGQLLALKGMDDAQ
jgi:hypothetical protein